jgi:hypothetical protein
MNSTLVLPARQGDASPRSAHDCTPGLEVGLRLGFGTALAAGLGEAIAGDDEVVGIAGRESVGRGETGGAQATTTSPTPRTATTSNLATATVEPPRLG